MNPEKIKKSLISIVLTLILRVGLKVQAEQLRWLGFHAEDWVDGTTNCGANCETNSADGRSWIVENCEFMDPNNTLSVEDSFHVLLRNNRFAVPSEQGYIGSGLKEALILPMLKP